MIVEFDKSFLKSIDVIKDPKLLYRVEKLINKLEEYHSIDQINNMKKLIGFKSYYRIRISDYRIGFELINSNTLRMLIIAHRKDIYNLFP